MKTPPRPIRSIRDRLRDQLKDSGACSRRFLYAASGKVCIGDIRGSREDLLGKSVLLSMPDQLSAAMALIGLDGTARRIVICPPDLDPAYLPSVKAQAGIDEMVCSYEPHSERGESGGNQESCATEWVLLTSGTTGAPKMIVHSLASLTAAIDLNRTELDVWGTFYDIRRYGGLQIFLRAILGHGSLILSSAGEETADHLVRLGAHGVTRLSGTPSHWRRALMSPEAHRIAPKYVRLSGEMVDQTILNTLHSFYPGAAIGHAFASTEAGVAFEVDDGLAGFPASFLGKHGDVEMRVVNDSLQIRSSRVAARYLDEASGPLTDDDGFVDTGDVIEQRGDRCYFLGRRNGVINVGGLKVYPEEVEAVINSHPAVRMSLVRPRRNAFTGALVAAEVVLKDASAEPANFKNQLLEICAQKLPPHKIPATIRCVPALNVAAAGKLVRRCA